MSRKARIPDSVKEAWSCVRAWAAVGGYGPYKPVQDDYLDKALVVLEHEAPGDGATPEDAPRNPMRRVAGVVQELLLGGDEAPYRAVILVDLSALMAGRGAGGDSDRSGDDESEGEEHEEGADEGTEGEEGPATLESEALLPTFGKRIEKPVVRFLSRLFLRGATVVARGAACPLALKLLSPVAPRALSSTEIARLVLLQPALPPAFVNEQLGREEWASKGSLRDTVLDVWYATKQDKRRRDPVLRHYAPDGGSAVADGAGDAAALFAVAFETGASAVYDPDRHDANGHRMFLSDLAITMDPETKCYRQVARDATSAYAVPETPPEVAVDVVPLDACTAEVGALVLRGKRCILCRSLRGEWAGVRVPSTPDDGCVAVAAAIAAAADHCDVDEAEFTPLPHIPPITVFRPRGRPVIQSLHVLYAASPPPCGSDDDGEDVSPDEDDLYDWYSFPRAAAALRAAGDPETALALHGLAALLQGAAAGGALPVKWGGVFGAEALPLGAP